jgi:hypothetical protein
MRSANSGGIDLRTIHTVHPIDRSKHPEITAAELNIALQGEHPSPKLERAYAAAWGQSLTCKGLAPPAVEGHFCYPHITPGLKYRVHKFHGEAVYVSDDSGTVSAYPQKIFS